MKIEVLLTEQEISSEFLESVEARDLPEKFFYWTSRSVRSWLELSEERPFAAVSDLWAAAAQTLAQAAHDQLGGDVSVLSLGAGDGARDRAVLEALNRSGCTVRYYPVDASQNLLESACAMGDDLEMDTLGIKCDISSPVHLVLASDAAEGPRVVLLNGNTIGGFDPLDLLRNMGSQCLHPGDLLALDAEIASAGSLKLHDSALERRFTGAPLKAMGVSAEDGELKSEQKRDDRRAGLSVITRYFRAHTDQHLNVFGQPIELPRGEKVELNFSYSFAPDSLQALVEERTGVQVIEQFASPETPFRLLIGRK